MFTILTGTSAELAPHVKSALAEYRHKVFVEHLGWELPDAQPGIERDQFDRPDTVYVVVKDIDGHICGCARLLSTQQAYLLGSIFPELLGNQALPCAPEIWELSRYTTQRTSADVPCGDDAKERFRLLLKAVVETALEKGARRLITFSYTSVERLARSFGIHVHRAGAPQPIDGRPVVAFWVELDLQTFAALGIAIEAPHRAH